MSFHGLGWAALIASLMVPAVAQVAEESAPLPAGLHNVTLTRAGEPPVHFTLFVPASYSAADPTPLVLALHFGVRGGDATGAGSDVFRALIGPAMAPLGAIIVAPDSVRGDWSTPENDKAVSDVLDWVQARYTIDKKKVAVTGYSMGGAGTWHFAGKYPERFTAAIPVAGRPPASASGWRVPVYAIHSRDDQVVPFGPAEARIAELQKAGVNAKLAPLSGITHYETFRFRDALKQAIPWLKEVWK